MPYLNKKVLNFLWIIPAVAAFAVNFGVLSNGFVWDDLVVLKDQLLAFQSARDIFLPPPGIPHFGMHYYRPVIILSFLLDKTLWGSSPLGFHFSVFLIHIVNTILVFFLARQIFQRFEAGPFGALFASLLFAVHPIHTESVAWMAGRSDLLSALFLFISLSLYLKYLEKQEARSGGRQRKAGYLLLTSSLTFLLAALAKEVALSFLLLLPILDVSFSSLRNFQHSVPQENLKRNKKQHDQKGEGRFLAGRKSIHFKAYLPFLAAAVVYFLLRFLALRNAGGRLLPANTLLAVPQNIINSYGFYLEKVFLPVNLMAFIPEIPGSKVYTTFSILALLVLIFTMLFAYARKKTEIFFLISFFFLSLLPSVLVAVLKVSDTPLAERYLYIPSLSFTMMAGYLALFIPLSLKSSSGSKRLFSVLIIMFLLALSGAYSLQSLRRIPIWKNDIVFWKDIVRKLPHEGLPHLNLGVSYSENNRMEDAEKEYLLAIRARNYDNDGRATAYNNLASIYIKKGEFDRAEGMIKTAITLRPNYANSYYNMAFSFWMRYSEARKKEGWADPSLPGKAIEHLEKAIEINPQFVTAHALIGQIYLRLGRYGRAKEHLEIVLSYEQEGRIAQAAREMLEKIPIR